MLVQYNDLSWNCLLMYSIHTSNGTNHNSTAIGSFINEKTCSNQHPVEDWNIISTPDFLSTSPFSHCFPFPLQG